MLSNNQSSVRSVSRQVAFAGSRRLASGKAKGLVVRAVRSVLSSGRFIAVGCAQGVDQWVIQTVLAQGQAHKLVIYAVGGPTGRGFGSGSCPLGLLRRAARQGAVVLWWAGGYCHCFGRCSCLRQRLRRRTLRLVRESSALVAFPLGFTKVSPGTWLAVRAAVRQGKPVRVFPFGLRPERLPKRLGAYWVSWQPGHLRWSGHGWEVAGGLVWAHSFQPVTEPIRKKPADSAGANGQDPDSRWVWYLLQFDSLRSEAEIYEREWDYELEPGEETEFELMGEEEQLEGLPDCCVPDFSERVVAEAFGVGRA